MGCEETCGESWINEMIGHRIICRCECHNKNRKALGKVGSPSPNATDSLRHHMESSKDD